MDELSGIDVSETAPRQLDHEPAAMD